MIVRFCYAVYLQLLNQHNQEFRPYSLSRGAREGSGNETTLARERLKGGALGETSMAGRVGLSGRVVDHHQLQGFVGACSKWCRL